MQDEFVCLWCGVPEEMHLRNKWMVPKYLNEASVARRGSVRARAPQQPPLHRLTLQNVKKKKAIDAYLISYSG